MSVGYSDTLVTSYPITHGHSNLSLLLYLAVAGLPVPRNDHAAVMATFATKCLRRFEVLTKRLEIVLGPGTGSLALRVGLHSGPVTAGVLRGENTRFQLFGDVSRPRIVRCHCLAPLR
jgi:class 3 adenylate cyclase